MTRSSVAVIDYGMGNLHSVASALQHVDADVDVRVTDDRERIAGADRVVFPGVGAIRDCMAEIRRLGLEAAVHEAIASGKPVLAVCVGMQAVMQRSEENQGVECLGELPGEVRFFGDTLQDAEGNRLKVPHMGWNNVHQRHEHPLWQGIEDGSRFYFVHSYYVQTPVEELIAGAVNYGVEFHAALARDNLFAAQFHPEKSGEAGLQLLRNFLVWKGL